MHMGAGGAVLRSLHGEGVFEFFHPGLQILDFSSLLFQEAGFLSGQTLPASVRNAATSSLVAAVLKPSLIIAEGWSMMLFVFTRCIQA